VNDDSVETRDIYLPAHREYISHIALDVSFRAKISPAANAESAQIGGSLAKVVYFTRSNYSHKDQPATLKHAPPLSPGLTRPNGFLGPEAIDGSPVRQTETANTVRSRIRRRSSGSTVPGGRLNFVKFETDQIDECIEFISNLISTSSISHGISIEQMKKSVAIMATGGGAHLFYDKLVEDLGVEVRREEEMDCLITGLSFLIDIPNEVFWYSDELVEAVSHRRDSTVSRPHSSSISNAELPRPSPNPPMYSLVFDTHPKPQYPCMLVNIGSGVSIIKIDEQGRFERISGTSLGGGTLWGLLSLLTGAGTFDGEPARLAFRMTLKLPEMLAFSDKGDNSTVDMLVGDICRLAEVACKLADWLFRRLGLLQNRAQVLDHRQQLRQGLPKGASQEAVPARRHQPELAVCHQ
jgi:type II pantothenate kinase